MSTSNTLTIYWCPASYLPDYENWASLYRDPISVLNVLRSTKNVNNNGSFFACPATSELFENVFTVLSNLTDTHVFPVDLLKQIHKEKNEQVLPTNGKIQLSKIRDTSLEGYVNILYNMKWFFFSEEPVSMTFTPPYYPVSSPAKGNLLSSGTFDIGQWPRLLTLDYHIPLDVEIFEIKENDPLFYLHIKTDKKVKFQRIFMTPKLMTFASESAQSPSRYGFFKSLQQRYKMAQQASIQKQVLSEIKQNLID